MASECRICFSDDTPLISPCGCRGSLAFVHEYCLQKWFSASLGLRNIENFQCELCKQLIKAKVELPSWTILMKNLVLNIFRDRYTTLKTSLYMFYMYLFLKRVCSVVRLISGFLVKNTKVKVPVFWDSPTTRVSCCSLSTF